ncbi:MAG: Fe-S cluster assembly protein SufD [Thermoanaerobaculia bacterium]
MNPVETQLAGAALDGGPFAAEAAAVAALPQPEALRRLRASAYARFRELGYPSPREEEWRFTNVAPVARTNFERPAPAADPRRRALEVAPFRLEGTREIVFVDGRFAPELSSAEPPAGMRIASFAALAAQGDLGAFAAVLGRKAGFVDQPFLALSTALFEDGLGIEIASGATVAEPLHVIFHSTAAASASASFPRLVILAGENSEATVVESHCGAPGAVYLASAATEIVAAPAARLEHYEFQRESREAFHFATLHVETGRAATVATHSFSLGGAIARHDIRGVLAGEGGEATFNGLYLVDGRQLVDTHMRIDHVAPRCASHELYKGILEGKSRAVFNGRIHVHPGAQKTDAKQTNRNLLLSDDALVNTNPQLEIFADDVKCTHGSTVGQLDAEAVFYLRSRGIGAEAAKSLLTYAFASDLVNRVKVDSLQRELQEFLFAWIPQGEVVRHAV